MFSGWRTFVFCGLPDPCLGEEDFFSCCSPFAYCGDKEDPFARFVSKKLSPNGRSSLVVDFNGTTPGDILGVNFYDPMLRREDLKSVANQVFKMTHQDRFNPNSSFARIHQINRIEDAKMLYTRYRQAYEEFCRAKRWLNRE